VIHTENVHFSGAFIEPCPCTATTSTLMLDSVPLLHEQFYLQMLSALITLTGV